MTKDAIYYELGCGITCIDTEHIRPDFVATYLIKGDNNYAFVDSGSYLSVPIFLATLKAKSIATNQVKYIFLTHIHLDHAGGAGELLRHLPNAKVVVHSRGAEHLMNPEKLKAGVISVYGELFFKQHLGDITPIAADKIIIAKDESIYLDSRKLEFIATEGHARHHYCIYDELSQGIFSGDTLGVSYREFDTNDNIAIFPPTSPTQFDPEAWCISIDKLMSYKPKYAYLTHFNKVSFSQETADILKAEIINFANIAKNAVIGISSKTKKHKNIKQALTQHLLSDKRLAKLSINTNQQLAILKGDIEICTQGLMVWLSRL